MWNIMLIFNWINLSNIPSVLFMIFVSITAVLVYLYFTSEVMNKKVLSWLLIAVVVIFIISCIVISWENRPPHAEFRLTLFPITSTSAYSEADWLGEAFWVMLGQQLESAAGDRASVITAEWTKKIVKPDSLSEPDYLSHLNRKIQGEYFLIGKLSGDGTAVHLTYQLLSSSDKKIALQGVIKLVAEQLPQLSLQLRDQILNYFKFSPPASEKTVRYITAESYYKYLQARDHFQRKDYEQALRLVRESIAADTSLADAYLLAGKIFFHEALKQKEKGHSPEENFQRSFAWLSKAVQLDSSNGEAYAWLGEYYVYHERWSKAEQMLLKAYELAPNFPRLYLTMSRLHQFRYQKLGFKNEEQLFKKAIFLNPCYEDAYLMLADYYLFQNKREMAIDVLKRLLEINPNSVPGLMALGKIYLVRNEILKIIDVFNRVIELDPTNADAYYNLGILYYNSEDFDIAEKFLQRAVAIDNHLNAHLYLAYLYEMKGDYNKAIEHLRKRIRYRKGRDDEFAEEARKHLYDLLHGDSLKVGK